MNWLAVAALVVAGYLSSLHLSLIGLSHSAFRRRLSASGRDEAGQWLLDRVESCILTVALLRTAVRLLFFVFVLVGVTGVGESSSLMVGHLVIAGLSSALLLWVFTSVVASAVARHAGTGLLVRSLPLLQTLTVLGRPLSRVLAVVDEIVRRLSGASLNGEEPGQELLRSIEDSQLQGELDEDAATLLENVVEFGTTDVGAVMTPRTDIEGIEITDDLATIRAFVMEAGHSRIPVFEENLDNILGILYVKDLVPFLGRDGSGFSLRPLLRQPIVVPETKPVRDLLSDFQQSEVHMAMVIDEYGGTAGLVTIEDVLEELVGEIHDEHEPDAEEEPTLTPLDGQRAEVDGRFHIDDLNEELGLALPENEEFDTVGGFIMAHLGRVPAAGESFEAYNARFTALEASPTHVQKIGIELLEAAKSNGVE
ncbi:MAG: hemolysin family protein [Planctomycetota bacterium]